VTALDRFGRLTTCAVQPSPYVLSAWARGRHRLDVRLVVVGHDRMRDDAGALDGMRKEGLRTPRVTVVAKEHIHDHAILINGIDTSTDLSGHLSSPFGRLCRKWRTARSYL
jgi:hypothetical protein